MVAVILIPLLIVFIVVVGIVVYIKNRYKYTEAGKMKEEERKKKEVEKMRLIHLISEEYKKDSPNFGKIYDWRKEIKEIAPKKWTDNPWLVFAAIIFFPVIILWYLAKIVFLSVSVLQNKKIMENGR